jgi:glutamine phosphoribosylpyrophosphate amidotransferase
MENVKKIPKNHPQQILYDFIGFLSIENSTQCVGYQKSFFIHYFTTKYFSFLSQLFAFY